MQKNAGVWTSVGMEREYASGTVTLSVTILSRLGQETMRLLLSDSSLDFSIHF